MITECTTVSVNNLIDCCHNKTLVYLNIKKGIKSFIADYDTLDHITNAELKNKYKKKLDDSIQGLLDVITQLNILKLALGNNVKINDFSFSLKFDIRVEYKQYLLSYSSVLPPSISVTNKKPVVIDWNEVFIDKLGETVPNLFTKKTSKKYVPITYGDLIEILK